LTSDSYTTLSTFSWENTDDIVKVLVPLEGVTKPLVSVEFNAYGFDLRVTGLAGANYRCAVSDLHAEIVPGESSFMVPKSNKRVVVKLKKAKTDSYSDKNWYELKEKPKLGGGGGGSGKAKGDEDPMGGIMDLMKNMYNDGDDDMKKTIAQAFTDANKGKKAGMPGMDMPGMDMPGMDMPQFPSMDSPL